MTGGLTSTGDPSAQSPVYVDVSAIADDSPVYVAHDETHDDITRLPEYIRMGEIDMTLMGALPYNQNFIPMHSDEQISNEYLPMTGEDQYLAMDNYLNMAAESGGEYLAMEPQPDEYLDMDSLASDEQFGKLTFSND